MPKYTMSDGREFTDYNPSCCLNQKLQQRYDIKNTHEYRYFLQQNATKIMEDLMAGKDKESNCVTCPVCKKVIQQK